MSDSTSQHASQPADQVHAVSQLQYQIMRDDLLRVLDWQKQTMLLATEIKCELNHMRHYLSELRSTIQEAHRTINSEIRRLQFK